MSDCKPCSPGYYCDPNATIVEERECDPGYVCILGKPFLPHKQSQSLPTTSTILSTQKIVLTICNIGGSNTTLIESGSQSVGCYIHGIWQEASSLTLQPRAFPSVSFLTKLTYPCDFFQILGSTNPRPTLPEQGGKICPKGHYCPRGTPREEACLRGEYGPVEGLSVCWKCPPGFTCPNTSMIGLISCSPGHYCPGGTLSREGEACPSGTYLPFEEKKFVNECLACPPGKYCQYPGQVNATGPCRAGYLCRGGAKFDAPNDGNNGPCPRGFYCEEGTTNGTMCPEGTLRPYSGAKARNDCLPCTGGKYCLEPGITEATSHCAAGYYCPAEEDIRTPYPSKFQCPRGHFCPNGTANPFGCSPGTYQRREHEASCDICPEGHYCLANTSDPYPCPAHHYCPNGTHTPVVCPNGTFTYDNASKLSNMDQCRPCDVGHYCQLGVIAGNCSAGFLCKSRSPTPTPDGSDKTIGELCPIGFYCPAGVHAGLPCKPGLVITYRGARSEAACQTCPAGRICDPGSSIPYNCTVGYYCPYNDTKKACPLQTFNNVSGATDISYCHPCPAGYYCWYEGRSYTLILFTLCLLHT